MAFRLALRHRLFPGSPVGISGELWLIQFYEFSVIFFTILHALHWLRSQSFDVQLVFLLLVSLIPNMELGQELPNAFRIKFSLLGMTLMVHHNLGPAFLTSPITHSHSTQCHHSIPWTCPAFTPLDLKTVFAMLFVLGNILLGIWARLPITMCTIKQKLKILFLAFRWSHELRARKIFNLP